MQQYTGSSGRRERVAIAGFGLEGRSILKYLQAQGGGYDITVLDQQPVDVPAGVASDLRSDVFEGDLDYDTVWRASPPIAPYRLKTSGNVTSMTKEFFAKCPAPIIGVTGTKGKGTTCTLIAKMLEASGHTAHLVGNIGVAALDELPKIKSDHLVVFELSSFQLWDMNQSPHTAVVLMVEPEHLDVHKDAAEYIQAKTNIARWQGPDDAVVYHPDNELSAQVARPGLGRKIRFLSPEGAYIDSGQLKVGEHVVCSTTDFGLIGEHNHQNIAAAVTAACLYPHNVSAFARVIKEFKGLEHRLELVREHNGVSYYDDSFAANPASAEVAAAAFSQPTIIILGGFSRQGTNFQHFSNIASLDSISHIILMGEARFDIQKLIGDKKAVTLIDGKVDEAVKVASGIAGQNSIVLLSPGCPSFDQYRDFVERGQMFQKAVKAL